MRITETGWGGSGPGGALAYDYGVCSKWLVDLPKKYKAATTTEARQQIVKQADAAKKTCEAKFGESWVVNWGSAAKPSETAPDMTASELAAMKGYALAEDGSVLDLGGGATDGGSGLSSVPIWVYLAGAGVLALVLFGKKKKKKE